MKYYQLLVASFLTLAGGISCDSIDLEDRWIGPLSTEMAKNVLIEDYTGQKCSNCPLAHEEVEKLQDAYGQHRVVAVAIHGGPQAVDETNSKLPGLANEQGKEYNRRLGAFSYPKGLVDRQGGLMDFEKWNAAVVSRFAQSPKVKLDIRNLAVDESTRQLSFRAEVTATGEVEGYLQLWLTESDIVAVQTLPAAWGGGHQKDYVHQHVFRAAINGLDGEPLSLETQRQVDRDYRFQLREDWKMENMALVMFYYNAQEGVLQVTDTALTKRDKDAEHGSNAKSCR